MGSQLFQFVEQALVNLVEVNLHVDIQRLLCLFGHDMRADELLEAATELGNVLLFQRQTYGIGVSAKVLEQVATRLDGFVDVEACHRACRTRGHTIDDGQYDGRTEVEFRQS